MLPILFITGEWTFKGKQRQAFFILFFYFHYYIDISFVNTERKISMGFKDLKEYVEH